MTKKIKFGVIVVFGFLSILFLQPIAKAQTEGTLTFTFTETVPGSSKNVLAVWIEDNSGAFVKTRMRFWGNGTNDHLPSWKSNSGQNVVDAITGATRTASTTPPAFGEKTVVWDAKNVSGITVPDGTYKVFVESSWNNPEPPNGQHSAIINFNFDKSVEATHVTPTGNTNFKNISIDWIPANVSVQEVSLNKFVSVYPNPSKGLVNIKFERPGQVSRILVGNIYGEVVYQETINKEISDLKSLDLQQLPGGVYFVEVLFADHSDNFKTKIIISK